MCHTNGMHIINADFIYFMNEYVFLFERVSDKCVNWRIELYKINNTRRKQN